MELATQHEDLSKYLFGSSRMLAIMVEIERCEGGEFSTPGLVSATGLPTSTVHSLLTRLKLAELIRRTGTVTSDRVALYERRPHPLWEAVRFIEEEADAVSSGTVTDVWVSAPRSA